MTTPAFLIGQGLADEWALIAQKYAGYFYGRKTRAGQHGTATSGKVFLTDEPWTEPFVLEDDCPFCRITTDERVEERILGFQAAIDIEVLRSKWTAYFNWKRDVKHTTLDSPELKREFIETFQDMPRENRPTGWRRGAMNMTKLPFYLKRRLCIEWNHALRDWLAHPDRVDVLEYDFERHEVVAKVKQPSSEEEALRADLEADHLYATTPPNPFAQYPEDL